MPNNPAVELRSNIASDRASDVLAMISNRGRVCVRALGRGFLGPMIQTRYRSLPHLAVSARARTVIVGEFDSDRIEGFDWGTGESKWTLDGFRGMDAICVHNTDRVLVAEHGGRCLAVDIKSGRRLESKHGVRSVFADGSGAGLVLLGSRIEYREHLHGAPELAFETGADALVDAAFGPLAVVTVQNGSLVRCFDLRKGRERWRYDPGLGCAVVRAGFEPKSNTVCCIQIHVDDDVPPRAILLDGATGQMMADARVPDGTWNFEVLENGRSFVSSHWRLLVPSMKWERVDLRPAWS